MPRRRIWRLRTPLQPGPLPQTSFTLNRPLRAGREVAPATDTEESSTAGCAVTGGVLVEEPEPELDPGALVPVPPTSAGGGGPVGCAEAGVPSPVGPSNPVSALQR